jgi:predicted dehydrogenase
MTSEDGSERGAGPESGGPPGLPVLLVGAHGFGKQHLAGLRRLARAGKARLVGVCDLRPLSEEQLSGFGGVGGAGCRPPEQGTDLAELLRSTRPAVTVIATPIHTHAAMAQLAAAHGSHLLLEKPPAASWEDFERTRLAVRKAGRVCQVGFQSIGSPAMTAVRRMIDDGVIGNLQGIGGAANWQRTADYYERAEWAGRRRTDDGRDVVDGALTNPLAHAVAGALWLDGSTGPDAVDSVELELFRANPIECDDTSVARIRTTRGTVLTIAATLCAPGTEEPFLLVQGDGGTITYWYGRHRVRVARPGHQAVVTEYEPADPLENLINHLVSGERLRGPLAETAAFTRVLEAVRVAPEPLEIPAEFREVRGTGGERHTVVAGVTDVVTGAAEKLALFSELGAAWALQAKRGS